VWGHYLDVPMLFKAVAVLELNPRVREGTWPSSQHGGS